MVEKLLLRLFGVNYLPYFQLQRLFKTSLLRVTFGTKHTKGLIFNHSSNSVMKNSRGTSTSGNAVSFNLRSDGGLSFQPLDHLRDEDNSTTSVAGYGASFNIEFDHGFKFTTGYKVSNSWMNNGLKQHEASNGHSLSTELGFVQKVGISSDLFFRATNNRFHDIGATHRTFGLENAEADSWTLGYRTHGKLEILLGACQRPTSFQKAVYLLLRPLVGLGRRYSLH